MRSFGADMQACLGVSVGARASVVCRPRRSAVSGLAAAALCGLGIFSYGSITCDPNITRCILWIGLHILNFCQLLL